MKSHRIFINPLWIAAFLVAGLFMTTSLSAAMAQGLRFQTDPNAPVDIAAGQVDWFARDNRASFTDTARFQQGPLEMTAQNMQLRMRGDGTPDLLTATGNVVLVSYGEDGRELRRATAAQATYRPRAESLVLTGDVELRDMNDRETLLKGARLEIDMLSGRAALKGGKKGRARIELR